MKNNIIIVTSSKENQFMLKVLLKEYFKISLLDWKIEEGLKDNIKIIKKENPEFCEILKTIGIYDEVPGNTLWEFGKHLNDCDKIWDPAYFSKQNILNLEGLYLDENGKTTGFNIWFNNLLNENEEKAIELIKYFFESVDNKTRINFLLVFSNITKIDTKKQFDKNK